MASDAALPNVGLADDAHDRASQASDIVSHTSDSHDHDKDEADTCRICRGEGTLDEPLFYPCKCSGSIKYVHQECLMEWLSHTQKKHCELCKTSFRFTKLYHPGMPNTVPTTVFIRRAALHVLRMLVTWCRGLLVFSVWLFLLPWCMRVVWRSLFWIGDGGWTQDMFPDLIEPSHSTIHSARNLSGHPNYLSDPSANASTTTTSDSIIWSFAKRFLFGVPYPFAQLAQIAQLGQYPVVELNSAAANSTLHKFLVRSPSLLSDVPLLKVFQSHTANRLFIDVLEGQIITILVVIAFILIFLIREWVVQQQPVMNMVALGNDAAAAAAAHGVAEHRDGQHHDDQINQNAGNAQEPHHDEVLAEADADAEFEEDIQEAPEPVIRRVRRSSSLRRRREETIQELANHEIQEHHRQMLQSRSSEEIDDVLTDMVMANHDELQTSTKAALDLDRRQFVAQEEIEEHEPEASWLNRPQTADASTPTFPARTSSLSQPETLQFVQRPEMPSRDRSFVATEIRRSLEEASSWSFEQIPRSSSDANQDAHAPESWEDAELEDSRLSHGHDSLPEDEDCSGSWQQIPKVNVDGDSDQVLERDRPHDKGKARASNDSSGSVLPVPTTTTATIKAVPTGIRADLPEPQSDLESDGLSNASEQEEEPNPELIAGRHFREETEDGLPPTAPEPLAQPPATALDRALDWMFGDVAPTAPAMEDAADEEHVVRNIADEAPFVPFLGNEPRDHGGPAAQDVDPAAAAQAGVDGNDQEAIDDAEDLEGILELIGMQGPIVGLFQNALFSAVLISATLGFAVWLPYLWGKLVILLVGSPISLLIKLPLRLIAATADLMVDLTLIVVAGFTYAISHLTATFAKLCSWQALSNTVDGPLRAISTPAYFLVKNALGRTANLFMDSPLSPQPHPFKLSINSHAALRSIQNSTSFALNETSNFATAVFEEIALDSPFWLLYRCLAALPGLGYIVSAKIYAEGSDVLSWLWTSTPYKITLNVDLGQNAAASYPLTDYWTASDRMIAVLAGYGFFAFAGAIYLKRGAPYSSSRTERILSDILQQAGGVLKVILIISIEMLAFPLYCGLLLDLALLPLFQNATLLTRWQFTRSSPWTSGFVHWFIGTCYMFHFALFVSMCRKIMRKGVLYFIRDPDDPTFHPVRDVLERSVTTQLRKIAFSALVYGGLVIVCLGGVIWTLSRTTVGILPIRWSTKAPSLEFPLDLLFYNFLTPVIIRFYKPSDSFHAVYRWWFRTCAGSLRLSDFLFGEKVENEEGDDGKYVRAPASDQTRIPKGQAVFVEVTKDNVRKDGQNEGGVHNTDLVGVIFIPSWFRLRILAFVITIWLFMGLSGVSVAIVPLLLGRFLFSLCLPDTVEMNDIHAFSLGVYSLGSIVYSCCHAYHLLASLKRSTPDPVSTLHTMTATVCRLSLRIVRFTYVWTSLIFTIPFLCAVLIELYLLMPLHAYLGPTEPHVIHVIQDWTLGFLYARLAAHLVFQRRNSRPARAFTAVVRDGYLYPDAGIATRCFLLPIMLMFLIAIAVPISLSWITNQTLYWGASPATKNAVWRFSFPAVGMSLGIMWVAGMLLRLVGRWRGVVRDEVYLIGERLHNFGEKRAASKQEASPQTGAEQGRVEGDGVQVA